MWRSRRSRTICAGRCSCLERCVCRLWQRKQGGQRSRAFLMGSLIFRESGSRTESLRPTFSLSLRAVNIPYKPAAADKKRENFTNRAKADPLASCFMPGVPRIMYLEYPYQIFQAKDHIAITYEWTHVFRLIYTTTKDVATSRG